MSVLGLMSILIWSCLLYLLHTQVHSQLRSVSACTCVRGCVHAHVSTYCMCMCVWTRNSPLPNPPALSGLTRVIHNTFIPGSQWNNQPFITTSITIRLHRTGAMVSLCSSGLYDHLPPCWPFMYILLLTHQMKSQGAAKLQPAEDSL